MGTPLPCEGGCLCGEVRYRLTDDPVTCYACHCTDCQTATGSAFGLTMICQAAHLVSIGVAPEGVEIELPDGRSKRANRCARCLVNVWGAPRALPHVLSLHPGTLDDVSWATPIGHMWTRSAQSWVVLDPAMVQFERQPDPEGMLQLVRAWKGRRS